MRYIELNNNLPNQKFNIAVDNGTLEITLKTIDKMTFMSVSYNGSNVVSSIKVAPNVLLIGYKYIQEQIGDLIFTTTDNEYPYYKNFNNANKLYLLNYDEVKEFKANA